MKPETQEKLKKIKSGFRLLMDGTASRSMRDKGLEYKINWGIAIPLLKNIASEYGKDYELAVELWKENIRECKILATMIMPPAEMKPDMVNLWMDGIKNQEMAEIAALYLFQYIDNAKDFALKWLASDCDMELVCAYQMLSRLFMKGETLDIREINEYMDQAKVTIESGNVAVRHAVVNSLSRFSAISDEHYEIAKSAFRMCDLDIF